jgi:hypothetical protein
MNRRAFLLAGAAAVVTPLPAADQIKLIGADDWPRVDVIFESAPCVGFSRRMMGDKSLFPVFLERLRDLGYDFDLNIPAPAEVDHFWLDEYRIEGGVA